MSGWESWVIGLSVAIVLIAIVLLVIFLIMTLVSLRRTLRRTDKLLHHTDEVVVDLEEKIHSLDGYFRVASGFGGKVDRYYEEHEEDMKCHSSIIGDVIELALAGVSVWEKLRKRR